MNNQLRWLLLGAVFGVSLPFVEKVSTSAGGQARASAPEAEAAMSCDMSQYKSAAGLTAAMQAGVLTVQWAGGDGAELRTRYSVADGTPVMREFAVRKAGGSWATLGQDLKPEYRVVSGIRRFSSQQGEPLQRLGLLTPERAEKEKWYAYRDAPLYMGPPSGPGGPGAPGAGRGGGRGGGGGDNAGGAGRGGDASAGPPFPYTSPKPEDIRRASSSFKTTSCSVKTDGARIEITFNGLSMGIFAGSLQFTAYRGTNLIRMDAVASTNEPSVAYKFDAGLTGFSTTQLLRLAWNNITGHPAQYEFGAPTNQVPVVVRSDNRVIVAEGPGGSLAAFPMPHQAFWPRQHFINLGYSWYRKDADASFSFGVRQAEEEEVNQFTTFELINAPPGTMQRMGIYFYASPLSAEPTRQAVLAFTHGDMFKPVAGYKTFINHMHSTIKAQVMAQKTPELTRDVVALRSLGANIVGDSERGNDIQGLADYAKALATQSDKDFLMLPYDEPGQQFGGHWNALWPKSVLWNRSRPANVPFSATHPQLGKYYNVGSIADMQQLMDEEGGYWYHAHPRTKGSAGYPDAIWDQPYVKNDRYLGVAFKLGMGIDLSNMRGACEWRCLDAIDTMNNMNVGTGLRPKYLIADIDDYEKTPDMDLYPQIPVNYIKLDRLPGPGESWAPILEAMHNGNMWVTTGEILIKSYSVDGTGNQRTVNADLEWTFPLEFVEVTVGDGKTVTRQTIRTTDLPPHSTKRFTIPVDATGKAWVRFSAFDSAGNQAYSQPQWFNPTNR